MQFVMVSDHEYVSQSQLILLLAAAVITNGDYSGDLPVGNVRAVFFS